MTAVDSEFPVWAWTWGDVDPSCYPFDAEQARTVVAGLPPESVVSSRPRVKPLARVSSDAGPVALVILHIPRTMGVAQWATSNLLSRN